MNRSVSRRHFLQTSTAFSLGLTGLRRLVHGEMFGDDMSAPSDSPLYGPLVPDPQGVLDLPEGFSYHVFSKRGEEMDDGFFVPAQHDGMGTFIGPDGTTILIRNHEVTLEGGRYGAFGWNNELVDRVPSDKLYDPGGKAGPYLGGTTTLVYDTRTRELKRHFLSLAGTAYNCAGGVMPWNSWLTCEEWPQLANDFATVDHGYNFEVPATAEIGLTDPIPLKAMGRFRHEAVAHEPNSGIIYQTEDRDDGLFYRFIPNEPGELQRGGRLQALVIRDQPSADLRNWPEIIETENATRVGVSETFATRWIDLNEVEAPLDDLRQRGFDAGAARFARAEGMYWGHGSAFFACTTGGTAKLGQIWRYTPSRFEGTPQEETEPGQLELFIEPNDGNLIRNCDNITVAPWGDLFVCEDSEQDDHLCVVTPGGSITRFAHNRLTLDEFAGACFSPDGTTLFVNMQGAGLTIAITGPWPRKS